MSLLEILFFFSTFLKGTIEIQEDFCSGETPKQENAMWLRTVKNPGRRKFLKKNSWCLWTFPMYAEGGITFLISLFKKMINAKGEDYRKNWHLIMHAKGLNTNFFEGMVHFEASDPQFLAQGVILYKLDSFEMNVLSKWKATAGLLNLKDIFKKELGIWISNRKSGEVKLWIFWAV